ncbi:uncharacterized protein [Ptychodera flava]|uniref:uncharacterized protein n=1 Tax=Ptychodera flava TaxID=63121 RepID=UPI00396A4E91
MFCRRHAVLILVWCLHTAHTSAAFDASCHKDLTGGMSSAGGQESSLIDIHSYSLIPHEQLMYPETANESEYMLFPADDCKLDVYLWSKAVFTFYFIDPHDLRMNCKARGSSIFGNAERQTSFSSTEEDILVQTSIIRPGTPRDYGDLVPVPSEHQLPTSWRQKGGGIFRMTFPHFIGVPQIRIKCETSYVHYEVSTDMYAPVVTMFPKGCPPGKFGGKCENDCNCQNGATCHSFNGDCLCAKGWRGPNCITLNPIIEIDQSPIPAFANDTLTLSCKVYGVTVVYIGWYKGSTLLTEKAVASPSQFEGASLIYKEDGVSTDGSGIYRCTVRDDLGVFRSSRKTVSIAERQKIVASPQNQVAQSGSDVVLTCITRNRVGSVAWFKKGKRLWFAGNVSDSVDVPVYISDRYAVDMDADGDKFNLNISSVQIEDEGTYYCELGPTQHQDKVRSYSAEVRVLEPPREVRIDGAGGFHNRTIKELVPMSVKCETLDANPPASILWYLDGEQIRENVRSEIEASPRRGLFHTKSRITITPTYHNEGSNLTCQARSDAVAHISDANIQLNNILHAPVISMVMRPEKAIEGEDITIDCNVDANPMQYKVEWKGVERIPHEANYVKKQITFQNVKIQFDDTKVTCLAYNELGVRENYVALRVRPDDRSRLLTITLSTLFAVLALVIILSPLTYRYRREIRIMKHRLCWSCTSIDDEDWRYDAFVCYYSGDNVDSSPEETLVIKQMLPKLEKQNKYKLCIHSRDFPPGAAIMDNILNAIQNSSRTILVLSQSFVQSEWCRFEYEKAQAEMLRIGTKIIPIMFEDITRLDDIDPSLKSLLNVVTYLKWPGEAGSNEEKDKFWQSLIETMPKKVKRGEANDDIIELDIDV